MLCSLGHTELLEGALTVLQVGSAWPGTDSVAGLSFVSTYSCIMSLHFVKDLHPSLWCN